MSQLRIETRASNPKIVTRFGTVPTISNATAGSAATLTTPRAIYGNNFDGSAALGQIIASTYGGTGNGFTKFIGATTAEKVYTLPDASATILTNAAIVTSAQGGTGNGFTKFTGPTTAERTFTLPDASSTVFTSGGGITLSDYANDGAAAAGGIAVGQMYRNGSVVMIRVA